MRHARQGERKGGGSSGGGGAAAAVRGQTHAARVRAAPRARAPTAATALQHSAWHGGARRAAAAWRCSGAWRAAEKAPHAQTPQPLPPLPRRPLPRRSARHAATQHAHTARRAAVPRRRRRARRRAWQRRRTQKGRSTRKRGRAHTPPPRRRRRHAAATHCARGHVLRRGACACVAHAHVVFRLLVCSALTQQRHDGRMTHVCGFVQRRQAILRAQR
jgi:hypothetical protein